MKLTQIQYDLRRYISRVAVFIFVMFSGFSTIKSQNLLTESFNYASGTLLTNANWAQIAAGPPNATVASGNLAYTGTIASNFGNKVSLSTSGQDVYRTFTNTTLNVTTTAIYANVIVNVSAAQLAGDFFFSLGSNTTSIARLYIRSNGSGFSFGVLRTTLAGTGTVEYETAVRPFNTNMRVVLKYEQISGATNDIVKLYVNPSFATEPATADVSHTGTLADTTVFNAIQLYQGAAASAPTVDIDGITVGTTWASLTSPIYDYGDVPTSYDTDKDNVYRPAAHSLLTGFSLGSIIPDLELVPNSVATSADNNGSNGDGADEDAISVSTVQIRKNVPYTLNVPVTNTTGTKYLYAWIDFNNDGKFQAAEAATATITAAGNSNAAVSWTSLQTGTIPNGITKLYMRVRLSATQLIDATDATIDERSVGNGAIAAGNAGDAASTYNGELEDYQIDVVNTFDYGDVPSTYEQDITNVSLPAVHAPLAGFTIGTLHDVESTPASVTSPNQNNTAGDNAIGLADEDGLTELVSVSRGLAYSITVPVSIPSTMSGTKYLYGWLDLNGDGRFQVGEAATATTTATTSTNLTLTWSNTLTSTIANGTTRIYLRMRLSDISLVDFSSGANSALIDERSVGNGASATNNSTNAASIAFGEVEDYQLPVDLYDFGD
ncbi:MAG: hypothetical protein E2600_13585, partial [Chryseobacterium sp.]|nr:hypothetical protein [Chryseobacterium sp.]